MVPNPQAPGGPLPHVTLVLGGARSGKSRHAERLVEGSGLEPVYLATAEALDAEMAARIQHHRDRRAGTWRTVEAPLALAGTLLEVCAPGRAVLIDCLTLWLTNLMMRESAVQAEIEGLLAMLDRLPGSLVFVSNEVGQGVVPMNAMARAFVDHAGLLHQDLASRADRVLFLTAGIAQQLKP